ncbi:MAG: carbon-nitrogen family hydrolase, partial [Spirochaetia bacterium]|nr:carbon-nitrogen family hydrolase [Spirochaetia bacterium]
IENQSWVFAVNNTGKFYGTEYFGGSQIVSPRGECLLEWTDREGILTAEIDPGEPARWRKLFPALRDRKGADFYSLKKK